MKTTTATIPKTRTGTGPPPPPPGTLMSDGDFTIQGLGAQIHGPPRWSAPLPTNEFVMFEQDHMQLSSTWLPLSLGFAHPSNPIGGYNYYLIKESDPTPEGPIIRWTRTWCRVPTPYDEWETFGYKFPALAGFFYDNITADQPVAQGLPEARVEITLPVPSRVRHEFFLTAPPILGGTTTGPIYLSAGYIPVIGKTAWFFNIWKGLLVPADTICDGPDALPTPGPYLQSSTPNRTVYNGWCTNAKTKQWNSTPVPDVTTWEIWTSPAPLPGQGGTPPQQPDIADHGQLVAEDSRIQRWNGPLWERQTRYVLAQ